MYWLVRLEHIKDGKENVEKQKVTLVRCTVHVKRGIKRKEKASPFPRVPSQPVVSRRRMR
jgi:hypothetical protein